MARRLLIAIVGGLLFQAPAPVPNLVDEQVGALVLRAEDTKLWRELAPLAGDPRPAVRARTALALARIGSPAASDLILTLAGDEDPAVRRQALFALGRIEFDLAGSDEPTVRDRARAALTGALTAPSVAPTAAWSLGQLGDALEQLEYGLRTVDPRTAPVLAARLLDAWAVTSGAMPGSVVRFLEVEDDEVRLSAVHALRRLDAPGGLPLLEPRLDDPVAEVRAVAIRGLHAAPRRLAETRAPDLLRDPDRRVQCAAAGWLRATWAAVPADPPGDDAFAAVLRRSLDRSPVVRGCALEALGATVATRAVAADRLLEALDDQEAALRAIALESLRSAGDGLPARAWERLLDGTTLSSLASTPIGWGPLLALAVDVGAESGASLEQRVLGEGDDGERSAALFALVDREPARAERVARSLYDRTRSEDRALGVRALAALERAGEVRFDDEFTDRLWRGYWDSRELPEARSLRGASFELLLATARPLLERRVSLLADDPDRLLRLRALRAMPAELSASHLGPETLEDAPSGVDYGELARRILALEKDPARLVMTTERGEIVAVLRADWAPRTVLRYLDLVDGGALAESRFHRVIPGFVAQGGAVDRPLPPLDNEDSLVDYRAGRIGLALSGRDTGTSQFFITRASQPHLVGLYPVFGEVVEGQRAVDRLLPGDAVSIRLER